MYRVKSNLREILEGLKASSVTYHSDYSSKGLSSFAILWRFFPMANNNVTGKL